MKHFSTTQKHTLSRSSVILVLASLTLSFMPIEPVMADTEGAQKAYKPQQSNDVINRTHGGYSKSQMLYARIKQAFVDEDLDKAIELGRMAVDQEPSNLDAKVIYAEALYRKYKEEPKDTEMRNKCVKMWLVIYRLVKGMNWELSDKSQHTGFSYRYHEQESRGVLSNARLKELCGRTPKWREDDEKYLKKVLKSEKAVAGKVIKGNH